MKLSDVKWVLLCLEVSHKCLVALCSLTDQVPEWTQVFVLLEGWQQGAIRVEEKEWSSFCRFFRIGDGLESAVRNAVNQVVIGAYDVHDVPDSVMALDGVKEIDSHVGSEVEHQFEALADAENGESSSSVIFFHGILKNS